MTREEYEEQFKRDYGLTDEEIRLLGIHAVPCWCRGEFAGCSGWQMRLRQNHSDVLRRARAAEMVEAA
jgi:hypothetical protein